MKLITILSAAMLSVASAAAFAQDASTMHRGGGEQWLGRASENGGATTENRNGDLFTGGSGHPEGPGNVSD